MLSALLSVGSVDLSIAIDGREIIMSSRCGSSSRDDEVDVRPVDDPHRRDIAHPDGSRARVADGEE